MVAYQISYQNRSEATRDLSPEHGRMFEVGSGISPEVTAARGVETVSTPRELPKEYSARQRRRGPGWLATLHRPNGETATVFRPDRVDPANPGHKYEQPPKSRGGSGNVLDVHPFCQEWIHDLDVPVIFVEGTKKADSLITAFRAAGVRAVVVAITGVWNWLSDGAPIPDLDDIPLEGRAVVVMFDSDVLTKWPVQLAAKRKAEYLRDVRRARVSMTYLPHGEDGQKVGVDDYLADGGTVAGLRALTRRYRAQDFRLVRLGRDARLQAMVADLARRFWAQRWSGMGEYSARDVLAVILDEAEHTGVVVADGIRVELSHRRWRERARVSSRTFYKCLARLEDMGFGRRDNARRKRDKTGAFVLFAKQSAGVNQKGTETGQQQDVTDALHTLYGGGLHLRAPRLRWSSPGYKPRRGVVPGTRRVREAPVPKTEVSEPTARPGKIRGALLDALDECGGRATVAELCERLGRNPARARDLTRRKRPGSKGRDGLLVWLEDAGVITVDGDEVAQTDNWLGALDELRKSGREGEADERQRDNHREDRREYRDYRADVEAIRRSHERREAEMMQDAGSIGDLERVPDPDPELLEALRRALIRWPDHADDYPSWWASTLRVEDWLPYKPDVRAVEVALYELRRGVAA
jgi:hypothetical protein